MLLCIVHTIISHTVRAAAADTTASYKISRTPEITPSPSS